MNANGISGLRYVRGSKTHLLLSYMNISTHLRIAHVF